jgi:hypothetical protein
VSTLPTRRSRWLTRWGSPVGDDDDDDDVDDDDDKPVATPGFHLLRFVAKSDAEPGIGSLFAGSDLTFGDFQLADMNDTLIEHM